MGAMLRLMDPVHRAHHRKSKRVFFRVFTKYISVAQFTLCFIKRATTKTLLHQLDNKQRH